MRKISLAALTIVLLFNMTLTGCGAKKAESGRQAIDTAKTMETAEQKVTYLVSQAKAFYNSKEFQNAIDVTQYILRYLDRDSEEAKNLLERAKSELAAQAKGAAEDVKKRFGF